MSGFCCYSKTVDPVAIHQYYSPNCHKQQLVSPASYCMQDENHHCCSTTNYGSPSHRHIPNIASPLHCSHPSPHSHPHYTNQQVGVYHTPYHTPQQHNHRQMFSQPHTHACHGQRELIPSPTNLCATPPHCTSPRYARPLPQTSPTNRSMSSSLACPNAQLKFSPMSSTDSPPPTLSPRFRLAYTEEELTMIAMNEQAVSRVNINRENAPKKRSRHLVSVDISPVITVKHDSPRKSTLRPYKLTNSNRSIEISDEISEDSVLEITGTKSRDITPNVNTKSVEVTPKTKKRTRSPKTTPLKRIIPSLKEKEVVEIHQVEEIHPELTEDRSIEDCLTKVDAPKSKPREIIIHEQEIPPIQCPASTAIEQIPEVVKDDPPELAEDKSLPEGDTGLTSCSKEEPKAVVLVEWWFDLLPLDCVVLLGYREEDMAMSVEPELWQTGPIVDRISSRDLRTEMGTTYHLKGCLNKQNLGPGCEHGQSLSKTTIRKFKYGFPKAWKSLLAQNTVSTPIAKVEEKTEIKKEVSFHTPSVQPMNTDINSGFLSSLKRSSRGRTLKPSMSSLSPYLQTSTNIYSYDVYGNFQGFISPTIDLTLSDVDDLTPTQRKPRVKKEVVKKEDEEFVIPVKVSTKVKVSAPNVKAPVIPSKGAAEVSVSAPNDVEFSAGVVEETAKGDSASEGSTSTLNRKTSRPQKNRRGSKKMPDSVKNPVRPTKTKTPGSAKRKRQSRVGMPKKSKPRVDSKSGWRRPKKAKPLVDSTGEVESEEEAEDGWTPSQVARLKSIVHGVPAIESDFWERVASRLPGYTARECSSKYMEACTGPSTKKHPATKRQPKQKQAGQPDKTEKIAITGNVGTLKRKRQLRAALEHMDKGYVDDIFESTPFKKKVKTRVKIPDWSSESECDDEVSSGDDEGEVLDTPNPARRRMGAPRVHTPKLCDFIATPDLKSRLNRNAADNVMYQIQKAKKPKPKRSKPLSVPGYSKAPATAKVHFSEQKLRSIRTGETRMLQMFEDTDEEDSDDYPFSDIDNAHNKSKV